MINRSCDDDSPVAQRFIQQARLFLTEEYLPKIERCLERLADEQIWWRANAESNSIGNLILHLCGNAHQWIVCGLGNETDNRRRQTEFDQGGGITRVELLTRLRETVGRVDQTLAGFDCENLLSEYLIQGTTSSALHAIFHVTEHFSMHTGQVILLTKLLTASDLHFYDFEGDTPLHRWRSDPSRSS